MKERNGIAFIGINVNALLREADRAFLMSQRLAVKSKYFNSLGLAIRRHLCLRLFQFRVRKNDPDLITTKLIL